MAKRCQDGKIRGGKRRQALGKVSARTNTNNLVSKTTSQKKKVFEEGELRMTPDSRGAKFAKTLAKRLYNKIIAKASTGTAAKIHAKSLYDKILVKASTRNSAKKSLFKITNL